MKKKWQLLLITSALLIMVGCAKKEETPKKREVSKDIDTELVQKVSGAWLGEGEKESNVYDIFYEDKVLSINGQELEVTETKEDLVMSQTKTGKVFFYDFQLEGEEVVVQPSFPVEEGHSGGTLAPIRLKPIHSNKIEVHDSDEKELIAYEQELAKSLSMYEAKTPFLLKMKRYTHEGNPILETISFNGNTIHYSYDSSADAFGESEIINSDYKQMRYDEEQSSGELVKRFILFDPVEKESQKEVIFDL